MLPLKPLPFILILFSALSSFGQTYKQYADSLRRAYHVPELSYAVVDIGSTIEIAALGRHAINRQDTATLNDRFHLGSNTKALTAFVIAHYVEKGNLQWTTRFFDLFPEWKAESNPAYTNITLQDLLSHRAGILPFQGIDDPPVPDFKGNARERRKQFGKWVLTLPPAPPDDQQPFVYSNAGYTLAALMLEKATGKSWEQTVEKVLNRKLKLHVGFSFPENQKHHDTWGHRQVNDSLVPVPSSAEEHLDFTEPAGDLNIRLTDYIRFIQLNLEGLAGGDNYLKAETYAFLHKGMPDYAMGWYNIYENGQELSTHSGTAGTYYTLVHIDRLHHMGFIIFTNAYNDNTKQCARLLMRKLKW